MPEDQSLAAVLPGLARVAFATTRQMVRYSVGATTAATRQALRAAADGAPVTTVVSLAAAPATDLVKTVLELLCRPVDKREEDDPVHHRTGATLEELREKGAQLLVDSADVWLGEETHPAYSRILDDLSPDEARILRFLHQTGPQPSVDIRTKRPLGVGSELVEGGLSMIGLQAGVRDPERTRADLNNLHRLGLLWFSREQVPDPSTYQVVEVQPDVTAAVERAGRSHKTVYRSIELTPFGEDFCRTCFPD